MELFRGHDLGNRFRKTLTGCYEIFFNGGADFAGRVRARRVIVKFGNCERVDDL
jgi:hypothetical protein